MIPDSPALDAPERLRVDAVGLDLKSPIDADLLTCEMAFSDSEIKALAKSVKFSECLPHPPLVQIVRLRQFADLSGK